MLLFFVEFLFYLYIEIIAFSNIIVDICNRKIIRMNNCCQAIFRQLPKCSLTNM